MCVNERLFSKICLNALIIARMKSGLQRREIQTTLKVSGLNPYLNSAPSPPSTGRPTVAYTFTVIFLLTVTVLVQSLSVNEC